MARPSEGVALSSKSLIALLNYCTAVKFYNFESFEEQKCPHLMFSLDEDKAFTQLQRNAISYVQYNMRQNSRIYPAGARFNSSNYMPQIYWSAGCQMVALNYQTPDTAMQLNLAKFEWNRGIGFLLKPRVLRLPRPKPFHPFIRTPIDNVHPVTLSVKIILPEMAMIRFVVYDESNQITGQRFLPVESLNAGYRHLVLRDPWNQPIGLPTLFVHIEAKVYVPNHMEDALEALMNQIEHMKKQVRNLMEDLTEDGVRLGVQNPHSKLKTNELIDQPNLPKEMLMDTRPVVKPAKETLPPILMDARSRPEPVAATVMATEVTSQKKVRELEQKMKQSDEKMRKKFQEKEQQIQKKKDKVKVKANEERRKSQVLSDYDVKMEELVLL